MLVLELLGTLCLRSDSAAVPLAAQQKRRLGLLAILALGDRRGLSRERIEAYLWPESSAPLARHALDQVVYALRQALGSDVVISTGRELSLNPECVGTDLWRFQEAIRAADWPTAAAHYNGPLLDGFHFGDSRELQAWIDAERAQLAHDYRTAVESLAKLSASAGRHSQSVSWWRTLANSDPLSAAAAKQLISALAAAGDRVGAVKHARLYQQLVRQELDMEPDPEIEDLASRLSQSANGTVGTTEGQRSPTDPSLELAPVTSAMTAVPTESDLHSHASLTPTRTHPKRVGAVFAFSGLFVLLIAAVAVEERQREDHRSNPAVVVADQKSTTSVSGAQESYVHGIEAWSTGSKQGLDSAADYFRHAIELDSEYAEAHAALADAYVMLGYFGYRSKEEMFPKAKQAALESMRLDSTLPSAHPALAYELTWERDFAGANAEFRKATALDPTHSAARGGVSDQTNGALQWYPVLLRILGQKPEALAENWRRANSDPFSINVPVIDITFEKWFTTYPAVTGNTAYGPGTLAGAVLSRIDDGVVTHLIARYEIADPTGARSFKTVIQGNAENKTGNYAMNGIVAWGWMAGADVHVTFQRVAPCASGDLKVCFRGIIEIQRQ